VPPIFDAWVRDFGLERLLQPIVYTAIAWTASCSPAQASMDARAVACMDVSLCCFFLGDYQGDDVEQLYDYVDRMLDGHVLEATAPPLYRSYNDILRRVASRGLPLDRYRESRKKLLRCYRHRHELSAGRATTTFDEYAALRMTTIYVDQWLNMWEVVDGFYLPAEEHNLQVLDRARSSMIRWHVYENELASIDRDARDHVPNLVPLLALERGIAPEQAANEIQDLADQEQRSFAQACSELYESAPSPHLVRYANLLEACYHGGLENYQQKKQARYTAWKR
jgi:Terpene synthase family 2, C-terminal metal binding